jgi:hypothetical protein
MKKIISLVVIGAALLSLTYAFGYRDGKKPHKQIVVEINHDGKHRVFRSSMVSVHLNQVCFLEDSTDYTYCYPLQKDDLITFGMSR